MARTPPPMHSTSTHLPTPPPTAHKSRQPPHRNCIPSTPIRNASAIYDESESGAHIPDILRYGVPGYAIPAVPPEEVDPAVFKRCGLHSPLRLSRPLSDPSASSDTVVDDPSEGVGQQVNSAGNPQVKISYRPVIGGYFKFLQRAIEGIDPHDAAVIRKTSLGSADLDERPKDKPEPLLLPVNDVEMAKTEGDEGDRGLGGEEDEIQYTGQGITSALVRHVASSNDSNIDTSNTVMRSRKRSRPVDDDDDDDNDFEITGQIIFPKRPRNESETPTTPLRGDSASSIFGLPCNHCGCACRTPGAGGTGSGSQVLSLSVRANLLRLLLGEGLSFLSNSVEWVRSLLIGRMSLFTSELPDGISTE